MGTKDKQILHFIRCFLIVMSYISFFLITVFTDSTYVNAASDRKASKTIRVGYIDYTGFINKNPDGTFEGYGVDYLDAVSKYTGWKYEYVYDSFTNQLKNLKEGKIDLFCHAQQTGKRKKNYIFSKYSDGMEISILYTAAKDERYFYNDFKHFDGMRIAFLKDSFQNREFAIYAKKKGFTYKPKYYDTSNECFNALNNKKVDGVAMGSLAMQSDYKAVCKFGSDPFYFMSGKKNKDMMYELSMAQGQIKADEPYFETDLYKKYYGKSSINKQLRFTREEARFIKKCGEIEFGIIPNRKPFSYINDEGKIDGIIVDIIKLISQKTGIKVRFKMMPAGQTSVDFLKKNSNSFLAGILTTNPQFHNSSYIVSNSIYKDDVVLACENGMQYDINSPKKKYTLAIPKSYIALSKYIYNNNPEFKVITAKTTQDCIKLVQLGKADFMAQNKNVITPLMSDPHYEGLTVLPTFFMEETQGVVCKNTEKNSMIIDIINKCMDTLANDEISQFTVNHTIKNGYKATFDDFIYKFRYSFVIVSILIISLCVLIFITYNIKRRNYSIILKKNEQLADAVNQAKNANASKSQFLARISHEIRTPMNAIVGLTELARYHEEEPSKIEEYLLKIDASSKMLLNIINDVLDMSAIESARLKIANEPFDIHDILSSISDMYYVQCRNKEIKFNMNTSNLYHEILIGDGLRVNQILLNLISNAFKFTSKGGSINVNVREASHKNGKVYINFYVKDTGEGISDEMKKNLFQPFVQEEAVTARKHGGSGLGLSITKNLVEMMHGSISCNSQKGIGTEFIVSIPFEVGETAEKDDIIKVEAIRAIVIDSDKENSEAIAAILKRINVSYDIAVNEMETVKILKSGKKVANEIKICFIDWKEKDSSSVNIIKKIREITEPDSMVIIVLSYDTLEIEDEAMAAGADILISKPVFQSTIFNVFMKLSGGKLLNKPSGVKQYDFGGKTVLLAEDTEFNSDIAIELMDMVNIKTVLAKDGMEAVKLFTESEPGTYEVILMDIQMPVMDGYEATRKIRSSEHPDAKDIPIYAMTANAFTEDISNAINAGMNGHISKPIDTDILYSTLDKIINQ